MVDIKPVKYDLIVLGSGSAGEKVSRDKTQVVRSRLGL